MKLYNNETMKVSEFSMEEFITHYRTASCISTEAISDYLYKAKDMMNTLYNKTINGDIDFVASDALSVRYETEHVIKRLKVSEVKSYTVQKPEGFQGKYVKYSTDLLKAAGLISGIAFESIAVLKANVGKYINDSVDQNVDKLFGKQLFSEANRIVQEDIIKTIGGYFKGGKDTKVEIGSLLGNLNDIIVINENVSKLSSVINKDQGIEMVRKVTELTEIIDGLVEQEKLNPTLIKNSSVKKDLMEAIYVVSKLVEAYGYVYANMLAFYKAHRDLSDKLITIAKER